MSDASWTADGLRAHEPQFGDYVELLKPRVMRLVIFTALVGMLAAPSVPHPVLAFAALVCIAVGAGASGALNMWWDRDIDLTMKRTTKRPIPSGRVTPDEALAIGLALSGFSVVMLLLFANWQSAALLAFTIFFYAVIYSMWLKRATPQNIVIGGAAGAFPPMIGWAVSTGGVSVESVLMFALIFLWTPPHFWALALFRNDDYTAAGVPMLPVTAGDRVTRNHILGYALVLAPAALAIGVTSIGGPGLHGRRADPERHVRLAGLRALAARRGDGRGRSFRGRKALLRLLHPLSLPAVLSHSGRGRAWRGRPDPGRLAGLAVRRRE